MTTIATAAQFELRVRRRGDTAYGLSLHQMLPGSPGESEDRTLVVHLWGDPLRSVMDRILSAVRRAGYRPSDVQRGRREPFLLREEDGVRLGLLFLAIKPLRKPSRIEAISEHLSTMEAEEVYYWFSKATSLTRGRRAARAFRILLAEE